MVADVPPFTPVRSTGTTDEFIPVAGGIDMTFHEPLELWGLIVPLELPIEHRKLEARSVVTVRQHGRSQAR